MRVKTNRNTIWKRISRLTSRIGMWFNKSFSSESFAVTLILTGIIIFAIAAILFFVSPYFEWMGNIDPEVSGQLGDLVGGVVGAIWALAGVILFYRALVRERETTDQLQFNDTFFRMLALFKDLVSGMQISVHENGNNITHTGITVFLHLRKKLKIKYLEEVSSKGDKYNKFDLSHQRTILAVAVDSFMDGFGKRLFHYFGFLNLLLSHVNEYKGNRQLYVSVIKESLSIQERTLLFYYLFYPLVLDDFKTLVLEYDILGESDELLLIDPSHSTNLLK